MPSLIGADDDRLMTMPAPPVPAIEAPMSPGPAPTQQSPSAGLARIVFGGVNPWPFIIALVILAVVMLSFPKAAVPLGAVIVLGALRVDRQALSAFEVWQKGKSK